jgi:8-hydroxy-5-deazaflavin:NADPH oxidoreductase
MKKIGIIGSGIVAQTLGSGFLKHGYEVMLSSRDTAKLADWKDKSGTGAHVGTFAEAAKFGDVLVLAVLGRAAAEAIEEAGVQHMNGKTVIDTTNPIAEAPPEDGVLKFTTSLDESQLEQLQERFPEVHLVKAFSCVGSAYMVNPSFKEGKPTMFICGNSDSAKQTVSTILDQFGWETEDMGKATAARAIEPLCMLWCIPGFLRNQWTHAFKLVKA